MLATISRSTLRVLGRLYLCVLSLQAQAEPQFGRDILPLLSDKCFRCHGPDAAGRRADLRLDLEHTAKASDTEPRVIVPGDREASELWIRLVTPDVDDRMPPPDEGMAPLKPEEIERIGQWIDAGAPWGTHWAFEKPRRPKLPSLAKHPVDAFIERRIEATENPPPTNPRADARTRLRRAAMALTGLPPDPNWIDTLIENDTQQTWETLVERLLSSTAYGERMAMWWLDAARYADTDGYQQDATRSQWPWRDWVMDAFNANQPFDHFTTHQIAGDLVDGATERSHLATAFHRNHLANGEGGRDPEESRVDYVIDRANTTATVWLGLTLGCAQCHDHKFDPISQKDFYAFSGFFNSIDENGRAGATAKPTLEVVSPYAKAALAEAERHLARQDAARALARTEVEGRFQNWLADTVRNPPPSYVGWTPVVEPELRSVEGTTLSTLEDGTIVASGPNPRQDDYVVTARVGPAKVTGARLEVFPHASHTAGRYTRGSTGDFILTDIKILLRRSGDARLRDLKLRSAIADRELNVKGRRYGRIGDTLDDDPRNGWTTDGPNEPRTAIFTLDSPVILEPEDELVFVLLQRSTIGDANLGRFRLATTDAPHTALRSLEPIPLETLVALAPPSVPSIPEELIDALRAGFYSQDPTWQSVEQAYDRARGLVSERQRQASAQNVLVLADRAEPRPTYILERGVWDAQGAPVVPDTPEGIGPRPENANQNRADLAKWLVSEDQPLTARVMVNHLWTLAFGEGLVRTPEDFGLQGEAPTHPDLLDWLAVEFVQSGWDVKRLLRLLVTSEAFQRSSVVTDTHRRNDPENRLWTRASRFRWPSWMIRDQALSASGLLNPALGGPPTRPYQPDGVWREQFMGRFTYVPNPGPAQYRRSLYAFWRRTSAPTFLFDSAQRQVCEVGARRTNTPLHALTLLNDANMLEPALHLAIQTASDPSPLVRIFQRILQRPPDPEELDALRRTRVALVEEFQKDPVQTRAFLSHGQSSAADHTRPVEVAANLAMASLILNLDETITHE